MLLNSGASVAHDIIQGWWKDTGKAEDILEANRLVLDDIKSEWAGTIEDDSSIQGRVSLGKGSVVKKGALIRGPASIGSNTIIESSVYLGPYTSVGSYCIIRRGEIENSIIMDGCEVDVGDRIIDSLIGSNSRITSYRNTMLKGKSFILGESSSIFL